MKLIFKTLLAIAVFLVSGVVAQAATMKAVVTGTISFAFDQTGIYGAPQQPLSGQTITATFIYDTEVGLRDTLPGGSQGGSDWLRGGSDFPTAGNPTVSGSFTIGTVTTQLTGGARSEYQVTEVFPPYGTGRDTFRVYALDADYDFATGSFSNSFLSVEVFDIASDLFPYRLDTPFSMSVPAGTDFVEGSFETYFSDGGPFVARAFGSFSVETITVSQVPLPASAQMLLIGFGLLGGLSIARRRRVSYGAEGPVA